jgi:hypothetical protein
VHACSTLADARSPTQRHSLNAFRKQNTKQAKQKQHAFLPLFYGMDGQSQSGDDDEKKGT